MREPIFDVDSFARRHIGPNEEEVRAMLRDVGFDSVGALIDATVPKDIRLKRQLNLPEAKSEGEALAELRAIAQKNKIARSFIGAGYYDCITPPVIQRNILENPGWYTAYTPYQAEIAQGRLEALLNFQQMIIDLTALDIANASMLDEATAAAEAMALCHAVVPDRNTFFVADNCHPQTIAVVQTRAKPLGIEVVVGDFREFDFEWGMPPAYEREKASRRHALPSARLFNIPRPMARSTITQSLSERRTMPVRWWWSRRTFLR